MKVLFATSEFADFAKAGGLGDVSAGLPRALLSRDIDVRVLLPAYPEVIAKASDIAVVAHLPGRAGMDPCCIGAPEARMPAPRATIGPITIFASRACRLPPPRSPPAAPA